jgi:hypothetical protein
MDHPVGLATLHSLKIRGTSKFLLKKAMEPLPRDIMPVKWASPTAGALVPRRCASARHLLSAPADRLVQSRAIRIVEQHESGRRDHMPIWVLFPTPPATGWMTNR